MRGRVCLAHLPKTEVLSNFSGCRISYTFYHRCIFKVAWRKKVSSSEACVVSYTGSWFSASTGDGINMLLKRFYWFEPYSWKCKQMLKICSPIELGLAVNLVPNRMEFSCTFGPQPNRVYLKISSPFEPGLPEDFIPIRTGSTWNCGPQLNSVYLKIWSPTKPSLPKCGPQSVRGENTQKLFK